MSSLRCAMLEQSVMALADEVSERAVAEYGIKHRIVDMDTS